MYSHRNLPENIKRTDMIEKCFYCVVNTNTRVSKRCPSSIPVFVRFSIKYIYSYSWVLDCVNAISKRCSPTSKKNKTDFLLVLTTRAWIVQNKNQHSIFLKSQSKRRQVISSKFPKSFRCARDLVVLDEFFKSLKNLRNH